ncbi:winged helix-turn-helix transcriptional regulator [Streptomyces sp. SP18ES09]|uniref:winged helix-turn-helix transcriptional regulator n=1 Tax=Streptomyces sp. SP18ES09 TaxID=3002532 RepID=UPI003FCECC7E
MLLLRDPLGAGDGERSVREGEGDPGEQQRREHRRVRPVRPDRQEQRVRHDGEDEAAEDHPRVPEGSLLVIALLDRRVLRFTEVKREIDGVSQRMLTVTLRQLERDGLVKRTVHPVVPPRVDYELTALGATLHTTIRSLVTWTERHQNEIAAAREAYDAREAAGV